MSDRSLSYHKLINHLKVPESAKFSISDDEVKSFKVVSNFPDEEKFVEPIFSLLSSTDGFEQSDVILISAPGATGKTMLTNSISKTLGLPVLDLSVHEPVASYSLTGVLTRTFGPTGFANFTNRLSDGSAVMLVDALDEGLIKTADAGYFAFLDDVATYAKNAKGTAFVLLGRTNIVELTGIYLEEKGLKTSLIRIEPFTEDQAKTYIDRHIEGYPDIPNKSQYILARDYIITALESFFKNQNEINRNTFRQFIGYAPVLNAIATLFKQHKNYHKLLDELKGGEARKIDLLIEIVTMILSRERRDKILPNLLMPMVENRSEDFRKEVYDQAYSIKEQCARLLAREMGEVINIEVSSDVNFNNDYNKKIQSFADEHPFIGQSGIQNIVFLSFIIATLVRCEEYQNLVYRYLKTKYRNPYPLFDIYNHMCGDDRLIDLKFAPYLFSSLQALDSKEGYSYMEVFGDSDEGEFKDLKVNGAVAFSRPGEDRDVCFNFSNYEDDEINLSPTLTNLTINVPMDFHIPGKKIELLTPVDIECRRLSLAPTDVLIGSGGSGEGELRLCCEEFNADYGTIGTISLGNRENFKKEKFEILSGNQLTYPFVDFQSEWAKPEDLGELTGRLHKLQKLMSWFRSHSKGELARYKELIDNVIVGSNEDSRKIVKKLLDKNVFFVKENKYVIDADKLIEVLDTSLEALRNNIVSEKVKAFLIDLD